MMNYDTWSDADLIDELIKVPDGLSDWEIDFIERVARQVRYLTTKQRWKAEQILEKLEIE